MLIAISMAGCATDGCSGWSAIRPSRSDKLTDGTARQILAHNQFGVRQGCWAKPTPIRALRTKH
jgi:hypothetical protein